MPKLEYQAALKEFDQGLFWPVYWIYGSERWKVRDLLAKIQAAVQLSFSSCGQTFGGFQVFDGDTTDVTELVDQARSLVLGGGTRVLLIRDAHLLKTSETKGGDRFASLMGPRAELANLESLCIFVSKDLDGRKKSTKLLLDQAAVVSCEEILEVQRESWVHRLAQERSLVLSASNLGLLCSFEPWSIDQLDQELEKLALAQSDDILTGVGANFVPDFFIEELLNRNLKKVLPMVHLFANETQVALPLLGLLGWNVRQLACWLNDQEKGTRDTKINPYLVSRFQAWSQKWSLPELLQFQEELVDLDFHLKQTPLLPLGLWTSLVCRVL